MSKPRTGGAAADSAPCPWAMPGPGRAKRRARRHLTRWLPSGGASSKRPRNADWLGTPWMSREACPGRGSDRRGRRVAAGLAEPMPRLAQRVAASPLEAAIHDAYGQAFGADSYNLLGPEFVSADSRILIRGFQRPVSRPVYAAAPGPRCRCIISSALDPLSDAELRVRIDDGLPETLPEWIAADGLTHLKIKLAGDDLQWDVDRVVAVEAVAVPAELTSRVPRLELLT